jgi:hypothetical protein
VVVGVLHLLFGTGGGETLEGSTEDVVVEDGPVIEEESAPVLAPNPKRETYPRPTPGVPRCRLDRFETTGGAGGQIGLEGRVGLTRRGYPGVPPGTYVEVEEAAPGSGWYSSLSQRDLRDGPSDGWDVWAATEDDLRSWLGPEVPDVDWVTAPLPDEALTRLVGDVDGGWRFRYVSPGGVAAWLHDAEVRGDERSAPGPASRHCGATGSPPRPARGTVSRPRLCR